MKITVEFIKRVAKAVYEALSAFFKKLFGFIRKVIDRVAQLFPTKVVDGMRSFVVKIKGVLKDKVVSYAKDSVTGEWTETEALTTVDESEVPDWVKTKLATEDEVESTEELVNALQG